VPKITLIIGLCGSGKTVLANQLRRKTGARIFESPCKRKTFPEILECLGRGEDCIVEEISLCFLPTREKIAQPLSGVNDLQVEWICFENDIESANWNVEHRTNKGDPEGHKGVNARVHPHYTYPTGAEIKPIERKKPGDGEQDEILEW
jgi:hypothetical protein